MTSFRRLHPDPADPVDPAALLAGLDLAGRAPADRPYVLVNFAVTVDGRAALAGGVSGGIGDDGDLAMFHALRGGVDAVMAGTTTLAKERYGRLVRDPARRAAREAIGLAGDPVAVIVSRSGRVPADIPLFAADGQEVLLYGPPGCPEPAGAATVRLTTLDPPDPAAALADARREHGIRTLLCEGGPTVFAALLGAGLVDELFLTVAPKLAGGGEGPTITTGPGLDPPAALEAGWALERAGSLFLRYLVRPA